MKKLLFISSRPIFPIIGGDQIRTFQSLRLLTKYFNIHHFVYCFEVKNISIRLCPCGGERSSEQWKKADVLLRQTMENQMITVCRCCSTTNRSFLYEEGCFVRRGTHGSSTGLNHPPLTFGANICQINISGKT